jgi:hypothetical protein
MRKSFLLLLLSASAYGFTTTSTQNAFMVENTSGTSPSGAVCYDFQTRPGCSATIVGLSSSSLAGGSTQYIQNRTTLQAGAGFNVVNGTISQITSSFPPNESDGRANVGFGPSVFTNLDTGGNIGQDNTSFGQSALQQVSNGGNNSAFGLGVLSSVQGGSGVGNNNTAIGYLAGTGVTGSTPTINGSSNTFVGSGTSEGTATPLVNATALGANAIVLSSNTVQLGSPGVNTNGATFTYSSGTVSTLTITSQFVQSGTAGNSGQVLTSNGAGSAPTWQATSLGLLSSTNTWSATQSYTSSFIASGTVVLGQTANSVTVSTNIIFSPTTAGLIGTTSINNASVGVVGELVIASIPANGVALAGTTVETSIATMTLTAGDWDITGIGVLNQSSVATINNIIALSAFPGNTTTDQTHGDNAMFFQCPASDSCGATIPSWRVNINTTTTYYLKIAGVYTGTTPTAYGRISARRRR